MGKTRSEIEKLYQMAGITNYQLREASDIAYIYGHNIENLKGFDTLSPNQKTMFREFIVNYYNSCGLDMRAGFVPKSVYYIEKITYCIRRPADECYDKPYNEIAVEKYMMILPDGKTKLFHESVFVETEAEQLIETHKELFVRYDYKTGKRKEWLHVMSSTSWY